MEAVRSYSSIRCGLPQERAGSAPALRFSRPAQRLSLLQPAHSPSRFHDPFHRRLQRLRCLYRCFSCYRVERTSSRAGLSPAEKHRLFTAHSLHCAPTELRRDDKGRELTFRECGDLDGRSQERLPRSMRLFPRRAAGSSGNPRHSTGNRGWEFALMIR